MAAPPPSGRQVRLAHGSQEAVAVEVGGGLRSYTVGGRAVLDGYGEREMCSGGRGQVLAPWPNRLADGRFEWAGRQLQAPINEPEHGNAIHGLARWVPWSVVEEGSGHARLECRLHPQPGWAWTLDLAVIYTLGESGLSVRTEARNPGGEPFPFGLGWHPYLAVTRTVDEAELRVPAAMAYRSDDRGLPRDAFAVEGTEHDFSESRLIGGARLDTCYFDITRRPDGRAAVTITDQGRETTLWMDGAFGYAMVFSGDTVPEIERRRHGLAVEPMTCPPDMLDSGDGRIVLSPGEAFVAEWGIEAG